MQQNGFKFVERYRYNRTSSKMKKATNNSPTKINIKLWNSLWIRCRKKDYQFVTHLIQDLLHSATLTIFIYFLFLSLFYLSIKSTYLTDPCQSFELNCHGSSSPQNLNDLGQLTSIIEQILIRLNLSKTSFVCYSTLFELLRLKPDLHSSKRLDLCVYDPNLNAASVLKSVFYNLGYSELERELGSQKNLIYEYNRIFGYYRVAYNEAEIYLYLFVYSPKTKYSFESIRRYGLFYLQFGYLPDLFRIAENDEKKVSAMESRVSSLNNFQLYMIDEMFIKVGLAKSSYFSLPIDPYDMLANFYPNIWSKTNLNCTN